VLAAARTGKAAYVSNDGGWKQLIRDMQDGMLDLEPRGNYDLEWSQAVSDSRAADY